MKTKIICLSLILLIMSLFCINGLAQAPEGFVYQAEVVNDKGRVLSNTSVDLKISILGSENVGDVEWYREYIGLISDKFGMITVTVGDEDEIGTFKDINWGVGSYYLYVQIDLGKGWVPMADPVKLMSVPYALYAKSAGGTGPAGPETDPVFTAHPAGTITATDITHWNTAYGWGRPCCRRVSDRLY